MPVAAAKPVWHWRAHVGNGGADRHDRRATRGTSPIVGNDGTRTMGLGWAEWRRLRSGSRAFATSTARQNHLAAARVSSAQGDNCSRALPVLDR
jgi:hypothetical protein